MSTAMFAEFIVSITIFGTSQDGTEVEMAAEEGLTLPVARCHDDYVIVEAIEGSRFHVPRQCVALSELEIAD